MFRLTALTPPSSHVQNVERVAHSAMTTSRVIEALVHFKKPIVNTAKMYKRFDS